MAVAARGLRSAGAASSRALHGPPGAPREGGELLAQPCLSHRPVTLTEEQTHCRTFMLCQLLLRLGTRAWSHLCHSGRPVEPGRASHAGFPHSFSHSLLHFHMEPAQQKATFWDSRANKRD